MVHIHQPYPTVQHQFHRQQPHNCCKLIPQYAQSRVDGTLSRESEEARKPVRSRAAREGGSPSRNPSVARLQTLVCFCCWMLLSHKSREGNGWRAARGAGSGWWQGGGEGGLGEYDQSSSCEVAADPRRVGQGGDMGRVFSGVASRSSRRSSCRALITPGVSPGSRLQ